MISLGRTDRSVIGRWWWTVDRWTISAVLMIISIGVLLTMAASPAVAERIGADQFHFIRRQFMFLPLAILVMFGVSLLSVKQIRRLGFLVFCGSIVGMVLVLLVGGEIKGATRWISVAGITLQPSEFAKPSLAIVAAWMFSEKGISPRFPGNALSAAAYAIVAVLLLLQPDVGMTLVVSALWFVQFFVAGLPLFFVLLMVMLGLSALVGAYFVFPHVASRVDRFLDPSAGDSYQIVKALEAFHNGGFLGRGPGEGRVKAVLPDAHTDFIMAVAGEEFGLILCLAMVGLFAFVVLRGFSRMVHAKNLFVMLAVVGLLVQFGLQAVINMASTLHLMPTKGMTLPFVSYGGSSMLALALGIGMVLALTRERFGQEAWE